jgi:hypothetical protein
MGLPTAGVRITNNGGGTDEMITDSDMMKIIANTMIHPVWMKEEKTA